MFYGTAKGAEIDSAKVSGTKRLSFTAKRNSTGRAEKSG